MLFCYGNIYTKFQIRPDTCRHARLQKKAWQGKGAYSMLKKEMSYFGFLTFPKETYWHTFSAKCVPLPCSVPANFFLAVLYTAWTNCIMANLAIQRTRPTPTVIIREKADRASYPPIFCCLPRNGPLIMATRRFFVRLSKSIWRVCLPHQKKVSQLSIWKNRIQISIQMHRVQNTFLGV